MKTTLLFGASGLVGGNLLSILLGHRAYGQVISVVRRKLPLRHPQLTQLIGDIDTLPALAAQDVFIPLGTTRKGPRCGEIITASIMIIPYWRRCWPSSRARFAIAGVNGERERRLLRVVSAY